MNDKKQYRVGLEFKASEPKTKHSILTISGYASTKDVDSYNEVVEPEAFRDTMTSFMEFPIVLFGHDWYTKPIGKVTSWKIDDEGLWVEVDILDTAEGRDIKTLIEAGILKAFSIGFRLLQREEPAEESDPAVIKKLRLYEISVVNVPANVAALIEDAKNLNVSIKSLMSPAGGGQTRKESIMDEKTRETIKKVDAVVGTLETSLETVSGEVKDLNKNITEQAKLLKEVQDKHDEVVKGLITQAEYKVFSEKIGTDILELSQKIEKAHKASQTGSFKMPFLDWKFAAKDLIVTYNDEGKPLSPVEQKAYKLFQMPVKYEGEEGRRLKMLRDLNDTVVIIDAAMRGSGKRYDITNLKSYKLYREMLDIVDPEFAKAMYSTGTGVGDEWVPTEMSSELYDLMRLESGLEYLVPHFQMPSNPYTWPIKTSNPTMYLASEASIDNPDTLLKSNLGTSNVTFTAGIFAIAMGSSPELIEDSIIAMVPEIRQGMAISGVDGYESLMINGDDSSTHLDNATVTLWATTAPEVYEKGFRKIAAADSKTFDAASTSTGVGDATAAFVPKDLRYMRRLMGTRGRKAANCVYVVSLAGYFQILNAVEVTQPGTYGVGSTWQTGGLQNIDGCQLIVSDQISEDLTAAGIYDGTTKTHTVAFCFDKTAFKIGERRGVTVEFGKNILTQQLAFVATMRRSFQNMTASTQYPVALGYNILD